MIGIRSALSVLAALVFFTPLAASAYTNPTPQRSYVSLSGSDSNNCGPAAPCRTWQAALAQTQPGGEILTLNSGGYGTLNITQAVTLVVPPGVYGGVSPPAGVDAVVINVPSANGFVTLRGVTINGQPGANNGITVQNGSVLILEDSTIENVANGIVATDSSINVSNSRIHEITGTGISVTNSTLAGGGFARILGSSLRSINGDAFYVNDGVVFAIHDCFFGGNANAIHASVDALASAKGVIDHNFFHNTAGAHVLFQSTTLGVNAKAQIHDNSFRGGTAAAIEADGPGTFLWMSNNTIFEAVIGINVTLGATVNTHQDNKIDNTATPVSGTLTPDTTAY